MESLDLLASATKAAKNLLGSLLIRATPQGIMVGKIVETEAYDQSDAASHSFGGRTARTDVMFGPPGHAYIYFTYGMHYCLNVVCGQPGYGSAVLIRAIEPLEGIQLMKDYRQTNDERNLTNGPAKLCQALMIDKQLNGHDLSKWPLKLEPGAKFKPRQIVKTTRIGITKDSHLLWRFYIKDNSFVSVPNTPI